MIYFVATPIGNLEDMSYRAIETLKKSDLIYCEDTRTSKKLLDYYDIHSKLFSYHKFNEKQRVEEIIEKSFENEISIISDAGMPAISDPGNILIKELIKNSIEYTVIPGPSAFTNALVLSGFNNEEFVFYGFFPTKHSEKMKKIADIENINKTSIFYESPHRILSTLELFSKEIPDRKIAVIREITKIYEDVKIFYAKDYFEQEIRDKGEIVLLIEKKEVEESISDDEIEIELKKILEMGFTKKTAVKEISKKLNINKNKVYEISLRIE